jgi:hypothetical protein
MSMMQSPWPLLLASLLVAPLGCTSATAPRSWNPWATAPPAAAAAPPPANATAAAQPGQPAAGGVKPVNFEDEKAVPRDVTPEDKGPVMRWLEDNTRWVTGAKKRPPTEAERNRAKQLFEEAQALWRQTEQLQGDARSAKFAEAGHKYNEAATLWHDSAI